MHVPNIAYDLLKTVCYLKFLFCIFCFLHLTTLQKVFFLLF